MISPKTSFARSFLIFCYGLFAISAQSLLFREFLTAFEGNDISVGLFFASWFFWISMGAIIGYRIFKNLYGHIDILFLIYIPAFILELFLIINARQIAHVSSYALLSVRTMVFLSFLVNIPVSIITGIFFPLACRWTEQDSPLPVSNVYILEAAGSFAGGAGTTILLAFGVSPVTIFFLLAFIVSFASLFVCIKTKIKLILTFLIIVCIMLCIFTGRNDSIGRYIQTVKWTRLLPAEAFGGSFKTAQAEYLYGTYHGQWVVVSCGSTSETLPDKATTGRIAAIGLSQKPDAEKILVIGSGLGLCYEFLLLDEIKQIDWTHTDSQYIQQIHTYLPDEFKKTDERLSFLTGDIRNHLAGKDNLYDIVIVNLPDVTSSVLNRYFTLEFYEQLKSSMSADGIVTIRISGGENIMGTELIDLGASTKRTLEKVFSHIILVPGDNTWFIASDSAGLTDNPYILQQRYADIKNIDTVLTPSVLPSVYLPDRADAAMKSYNSSDMPQDLLINRDWRPLSSLYSLLLALKQSGSPVTKFIKLIAAAGTVVFMIPVLVYILMRFFYITRTKEQDRISDFDGSFLVFSAGWLGIGTVIVLMYLYQTMFGSLYLHVGIISALFMLGLTVGAVFIRHLIGHSKSAGNINLFAVILIHAVLLSAIAFSPVSLWTCRSFALAFFLCGLCSGVYFPIAADQLTKAGTETMQSGSKLDMADHIGASIGSLATGLVLVPVLGTKGTILVFIILIAANIPAAVFKALKRSASAVSSGAMRGAGYILFGTAACVIILSNLLAVTAGRFNPSLPQYTAQMLAGQLQIKPAVSAAGKSTKSVSYFKVYDEDKLAGFIFSTQDFAPEVRGFGGKINMAVFINTTGKLMDFSIIHSNETSAYIWMLRDWFHLLKGTQLFNADPLSHINTVTGATVSSKAIVSAIELASREFANDVLNQKIFAYTAKKNFLMDYSGPYLLIATIFAIVVIYTGNYWSRIIFLVFNLIVAGLILNAQYSSHQVISLLAGQIPASGLSGVFLLTVGIIPVILLFGNIYCGYLCPFGAVQELVSFIIPDRLKQSASYETMRKARFVKYVTLFIVVMIFFMSRSRQTLVPDILIEAFNFPNRHISLKPAIFLMTIFALLASVFYRRFWCRYLCPAGAFLSLFNNFILFKKLSPAKSFARCEFGLTAKDNMDCIYCDRCRYNTKLSWQQRLSAAGMGKFLLLLVLAAACVLTVFYIDEFVKAIPSPLDTEAVSATEQPSVSQPSMGQPRDVDLQKVKQMIQEKKLSDHEASYYEKIK